MTRRVAQATVLLSLLTVLWTTTGIAWAHALLQRSDPPASVVLQRAPSRIHLWFSEDLNGSASKIIVWDHARHDQTSGSATVVAGQPRQLEEPLKPLPPGSYLVLWTSVSADDGHVLRGSYSFSVLVQGPLPSLAGVSLGGPSQGFPDGPTLASLLAHWLELLTTVVWVGAVSISTLVFARTVPGAEQPATEAERLRLGRLVPASVLVLAGSSLVVLLLLAYGQAGNDWGATLTGSTLSNVFSAQYGKLWIARQLLLLLVLASYLVPLRFAAPRVATVGFVAGPTPSVARASLSGAPVLFALGLIYLYLLAASGHAASVDIGGLAGSHLLSASVLVDWTHLLADALWLGGQIYIAAVLIPVLQLRGEPGRNTPAFLAMLNRFSPIAYLSIAIFTLSGGFNGKVHIPSWYAYFHSVYGWTLTIKIGLIGLMMLTSAYTVYGLRPRIRRAQAERVDSNPLLGRLLSWLRLNPLLGAGVLMASSVMFYYPVPLGLAPAGPPSYTARGDGLTALVTIQPDRAGPNTVTVMLKDAHGRPVKQGTVVALTTMLDMVMGTGRAPLAETAPGAYRGPADLGMGGHWRLLFLVYRPSGFSRLSIKVEVGT